MPVKSLKEFLDKHHVKYVTMLHSPAFTAPEVAATAHVPGREMAKTVVVKIDGRLALVVVPANDRVDLAHVREVTGANAVDLAGEMEFRDKFPGCEVGAMPPFGNLYDLPVFVAEPLTQVEHIVFNAGSHAELMQVAYQDFARLVQPRVL